MNQHDFYYENVSLKVGIIVQKDYFRYNINSQVIACKNKDSPLLYFILQDSKDQRLEVHPSSIEEVVRLEDQSILYLILEKRLSVGRKPRESYDFWNPEIFEAAEGEDPFLQIIYHHFIVIRLSFNYYPELFFKYLHSSKLKISLGFYQDTSAADFPIALTKLFWQLPWTTKYSIFILLTNRKITIDDLNQENFNFIQQLPNSGQLLEYMFLTCTQFSIQNLKLLSENGLPDENIPEGHVSIRKILVSPSAIVFLPHEIDLGNRVVREYDSDNFIRVNFVDEYNERSNWTYANKILTKFKSILRGFNLLGRYYEFLGFSNSQMRNHSCWMVHVSTSINADSLREKLGDFNKCKSACKYASRLGLCFSGTLRSLEISNSQIVLIEDTIRNGYNFSDGIGMISPDLMTKALRTLYIKEKQPICALQVRICGIKGVLTLTPETNNMIYARKSMNKFDSDHYKLEVCSYAVSRAGYLNRQIILILSGLGIDNSVFLTLQKSMINELQLTLNSEAAAESYLRKTDSDYYDDLIYMLAHDMKFSEDFYLRNMITSIFLASVKLIKSKARILAPKSNLLMGVLDEYQVLDYGQVFIQISVDDNSEIIQGKVAVAKNPCYHPGDIRVLEAVSHPKLLHLHNVLVFPQKGPRPHPNECSGSDLDGDLYFVTWNPKLVPQHHEEPMDYNASIEIVDKNPISISKVIDFFGTFMESENIGRVSNAHLIWADRKGIKSSEALELAALTSIAVDYPKTGIPAKMRPELRPREWPDFMEKKGKKTYESKGIIGLLYRNCNLDRVAFGDVNSVDQRFVFRGYETYLETARKFYNIYAGKMKKLMVQFGSENEFFLLTAQQGEKSQRKLKYDEEIQIQKLVSQCKEEIHKMFRSQSLDLFVRKKIASACYFFVYSKRYHDERKTIFYSFPWIFYDYLI